MDQASLYELLGPRFQNWKFASGIVMSESNGDPKAKSHNPDGGTNVGLFQIDTKTAAAHGFDPNRLEDPVYNTYVAAKLSQGGKTWKQWATAYGNPRDPSTYLSSNAPAVKASKGAKLPNADSAGPLGIPIDTSAANPLGPGGDLNPGDWTGTLMDFLKKLGVVFDGGWWLRVGQIALGIIAMALGVNYFAKEFLGVNPAKAAATAAVL